MTAPDPWVAAGGQCFDADHVVLATGAYQETIMQLHSNTTPEARKLVRGTTASASR